MSLNTNLLEQLFLIEVLVHKVNLRSLMHCESECKCKHAKIKDSPLRVRVKFVNFPCIEINQEEFGKKDEEMKSIGNFSSGKSFLFPMAPLDLIRAIHHFPLAITVIRKGKASLPPDILGVTEVQLTDEMCDTIRRTSICNEELPICSQIKDAFDLVDLDGEYVGYIVLFVRLSCFGQSIITKFQLMDKRSYLFKNTRPDEPYNCDVCEGNMDEDPLTYDIVPVTPMICTSNTILDHPCCEEARLSGDVERRPVSWKMLNVCDCINYEEDNSAFFGKASDKHAIQSGGERLCSCIGRRHTVESNEDNIHASNTEFWSENEEQQECKFENQCTLHTDDETDNLITPEQTPSLEFPPLLEPCPEQNPPVRYDTTSALSPAFEGRSNPLFPLPDCSTQALPPVRYDTTGALSPAFAGSDFQMNSPSTSQTAVPSPPVTHTDASSGVKSSKGSRNPSAHSEQRPVPTVIAQKCVKKVKNNMRYFKPSKKYVYSWGTHYPGMKFGHKTCVDPFIKVPQKKGWLWTNQNCVYGMKPRRGWRPGAIGHSLSHLIKAAPAAVAPLHIPLPKNLRQPISRTSIRAKRASMHSQLTGPPFASSLVVMEDEEECPPVPTLHIHRCGGDYYVSMHPPMLSGESDNIPLQFKILGKNRKNQECEENESLSTTSSELEIELFSPGAFESKKPQPQLVNHETQYYENDVPPYEWPVNGQSSEPQGEKPATAKSKEKKRKKGKKAKQINAPLDPELNSTEFQEIPIGRVPPADSPRSVLWEHDDQPTAVGSQRRRM